MPRPVDALPCGSRSTISTFSPTAASAVPRLIAVVVLPTPPFWLEMERTRAPARVSTGTGQSPETDDAALRVADRGEELSCESPGFMGFLQLRFDVFPL